MRELIEWREARAAFLALPAGSTDTRAALDRLANAEDALFHAPSLDQATLRRFATQRGWARFLSQIEDQRKQLDRMCAARVADGASQGNGNFGVLVESDRWALQYQRLNFRRTRALRAIGEQGLKGKATFTGSGNTSIEFIPGVTISGWDVAPKADVEAENRDNFHKHYRLKAVVAKQKLAEMGVTSDPRTDIENRMFEDDRRAEGY